MNAFRDNDNTFLQRVLGDNELYLPGEQWFRLLQDQGVLMTEAEETKLRAKPNTKFTRKTIGEGLESNRLFEDIYKLAEEVFKKVESKVELFPKFSTNKTANIHLIAKFIIKRRSVCTRADMHSRPQMDGQYANMPEFAGRLLLYFLSQREVLEYCHQKYGVSMKVMKTPTVDDKVRVAGIMFNSDEMRAFLPDMLGKSRNGNRQALDGASARTASGFFLLHQKFIDTEVEVTLPEKWEENETRNLIDELRGPGTFDEYAQFDPNNHERISLPWTQEEVAAVFKKVQSEYQAAMDKFTMGTGGGTGAPAGFSVWENRHEGYVVNYDPQKCNIYLSLVYMWDKEHGYCFVDKKDKVPAECAIGDGWTGDHDNADYDAGDAGVINDVDGYALITPKPSKKQAASSARKNESKMVEMMEQLVSARKKSHSSVGDLVTLIKNKATPDDDDSSSDAIVQKIARTVTLQDTFHEKIKTLRASKHEIFKEPDTNENKRKRIAPLLDEIKECKKMVKTLDLVIDENQEKLLKLLKRGDDIEVSDESGIDTDSEE